MFPASTIVKSLTNNKTLSTYDLDLVACPVKSCTEKPDRCAKGQDELCVKRVDVIYEYKGCKNMVTLIFHYQLKGYKYEGFIQTEDLALNVLIKRGVINKKDLKEAR